MLAALGMGLLYVLAAFGVLFCVVLICASIDERKNKPEVEPPKPQPQIVNLRPVIKPEPSLSQVLQETKMQIITTKYAPPAGTKELTQGE